MEKGRTKSSMYRLIGVSIQQSSPVDNGGNISRILHYHIIILSYYHIIILSYYHIIILSYYHIIILSYYHIIIFLEATFPYSENLRIPCIHCAPDLGFGIRWMENSQYLPYIYHIWRFLPKIGVPPNHPFQ